MTKLCRVAAVAFVCALVFAPRAPLGATPRASVRATQVWSRPALAGDTGVVYATLSAAPASGDRLLRVESRVATAVEIHESMRVPALKSEAVEAGRSPTPVAMAGMEMHDVSGIDVPAGGRALLAPGGYHVMLVGLHRALVAGQSFPLTFVFARAGRVNATAMVRPL